MWEQDLQPMSLHHASFPLLSLGGYSRAKSSFMASRLPRLLQLGAYSVPAAAGTIPRLQAGIYG